jgi:hypothetical protein
MLSASQLDASALSVILSVAFIIAVALAVAIFAFRGTKRVADSVKDASTQNTLDDRLNELSQSMQQSTLLAAQVSSELEARAAMARRLQEKAQQTEALAALHKEQTDAIGRLLDAELILAAGRIRRDSLFLSLASFVAGGGVSFLVTLIVHPFH